MNAASLCRLLLALLAMTACATSSALGREGTLADLLQTHWTARDGAPNFTSLIAETADGYLWLGDRAGLSRFDAIHFEHTDPTGAAEFSSSPVHALFAPPGGGLWIGYSFGGVAFLKDGVLKSYGTREGLRAEPVTDFAQQPDGMLWIATHSGLGWMRDGRWHPVDADWRLPPGGTVGLTLDSTGAIWTQAQGTLYRLGLGQHHFESIRFMGNSHVYVVEAPTGEVWAADLSTLTQVYQNPQSGRGWASATSPLIVDGDGAIWDFNDTPAARGQQGHALVRISRDHLPQSGATLHLSTIQDRLTVIGGRPASDWGLFLLDREGNIWLTSNAGPVRFSERNVRPVRLPIDSSEWNTGAIGLGQDDSVWISSGYENPAYRIAPQGRPAEQPLRSLVCVAQSRSGPTWLATFDALWRDRAGHLDKVTSLVDVPLAMAIDHAGSVWISLIHQGLFRLVDGRLLANGGLPALGVDAPLTLAEDRAERLWAGYADGRVAIVSGADVRFLGRTDGLDVGEVVALYGRRQAVWVGGSAGLARFDGRRFQRLLADQPGMLRNITGIVETAAGEVWLNTAKGIVRLPVAELNRAVADPAYRMSVQLFDAQQGLDGTGARTAPLPTLVEAGDGKLWAVTTLGAYTIDPLHLSRSGAPPSVRLESFTADDQVQPTTGAVALPPHTSALHFRYEGLSLTAPEQVRYRYRIDGVDNDWHAAQDLRDAYYMNLEPGTYRFRVQSRFAGTDWNPHEAELSFRIAPAFVQTRLMLALCALGAASVIWLLVRLRVSRVEQRIRIGLIARIEERERIARELHDTLLQGTQGLLLSVHSLAARAHRGEQVGEALDAVIAGTDDLLTESRDRIQELRTSTLKSAALAEAVLAFGQALQRGSKTRLRVVVRGAHRDLDPVVADEVFWIAREAVRNAFRHAEATTTRVEIVHGPDQFRLVVSDDGVGIPAHVLTAGARPGHWGIAGMRERAARIPGAFDLRQRLEAVPNAKRGTVVELCVAAKVAYAGPLARSGWMARILGALRRRVPKRDSEAHGTSS